MSTIPIITVRDVEQTSTMLQQLFNWKSEHGGAEFDALIDSKGNSTLWLHHLDTQEHPRFKGSESSSKGLGWSLYVSVQDLDKVYKKAKKFNCEIIEEPFLNENAGFREFTLKIADGYQFSVYQK
ncbi:MAG: hypothetical protein KC478_08380 [Bacteriovoracaceae bacterium]|nr:hypothetical protein [Bacteriovoracaceae bacterium]